LFLSNIVARIAYAISDATDQDVGLAYVDEHLGHRDELRFIPPTFNGTVASLMA
jgi:hypothetical protein